MSYFSEWNQSVDLASQNQDMNDFIQDYYRMETDAYRQILEGYPTEQFSGTAKALADRLAFDGNMPIFLGFLEGINTSLKTPLVLDEIDDETPIQLEIDFEKLYYNMRDAKAKWLYELEAWANVLSEEERTKIAKQYNTDHIAVRTKVGRNEACPCGSGKKYKKCCGKEA